MPDRSLAFPQGVLQPHAEETEAQRAARLLKAVLLTYRECIFDVDITKIELSDGILQLYQRLRPASAHKPFNPFPSELTNSLEHREAALSNNQCTAALALFARLAKKL